MEMIIALGANLGNREQTLNRAVALIEQRIGCIVRRSRWFDTEPLLAAGAPAQPRYLNGAVKVETSLAPRAVLESLLEIEAEFGRTRAERWAPRTLDLDLICADSIVLAEAGLTLPHPEMHKRRFVLEPMTEVDTSWRHPLLGKTSVELLNELERGT